MFLSIVIEFTLDDFFVVDNNGDVELFFSSKYFCICIIAKYKLEMKHTLRHHDHFRSYPEWYL